MARAGSTVFNWKAITMIKHSIPRFLLVRVDCFFNYSLINTKYHRLTASEFFQYASYPENKWCINNIRFEKLNKFTDKARLWWFKIRIPAGTDSLKGTTVHQFWRTVSAFRFSKPISESGTISLSDAPIIRNFAKFLSSLWSTLERTGENAVDIFFYHLRSWETLTSFLTKYHVPRPLGIAQGSRNDTLILRYLVLLLGVLFSRVFFLFSFFFSKVHTSCHRYTPPPNSLRSFDPLRYRTAVYRSVFEKKKKCLSILPNSVFFLSQTFFARPKQTETYLTHWSNNSDDVKLDMEDLSNWKSSRATQKLRREVDSNWRYCLF